MQEDLRWSGHHDIRPFPFDIPMSCLGQARVNKKTTDVIFPPRYAASVVFATKISVIVRLRTPCTVTRNDATPIQELMQSACVTLNLSALKNAISVTCAGGNFLQM